MTNMVLCKVLVLLAHFGACITTEYLGPNRLEVSNLVIARLVSSHNCFFAQCQRAVNQCNQALRLNGGGNTADGPLVGWQALEILDGMLRKQRSGNSSESRPIPNSFVSEESHASPKLCMINPPAEPLRTGEVRIRQAGILDVVDMQRINLVCLPENYQAQYFWYHLLQWPLLIHVAEAECGGVMRVVGYVLAKMSDDEPDAPLPGARAHGHITSIAVMRGHRNRRVAKRLMSAAMLRMIDAYRAARCSLHARSRNRAALALYSRSLGFAVERVEDRYYADEEDALLMTCDLDQWTPPPLDGLHPPTYPAPAPASADAESGQDAGRA
jgi:ribosomal protein S18 acetylase RimI-like enzyme